MKTKMKFYCILSLDIYEKGRGYGIQHCKPVCVQRPLFYVTETGSDDDIVKTHRKYCGVLDINQLETLIGQMNIEDTCDTMGSLTLEYGWLPAVSWSENGQWYYINVYVSPIFDDETMDKICAATGGLSESQRAILIDTTTGPHFDKFMQLLKDPDDCDVLDEMKALAETDFDFQPMLPLTVPVSGD